MGIDYWLIHGVLYAIALVFFPRITVWFFSCVSGGIIFWIFFLLFPRFFIPIIAAAAYWDTNPILVILSFGVFWPTEVTEKKIVNYY